MVKIVFCGNNYVGGKNLRRVRFILRKSPKRFLTFLACLVGFCYFVVAQGPYYSWDFSDCEIKDILYAVSLDSEISIVPDDTVSGKGDLKFAGSDFDSAFETFLRVNRLFVNKGDKVWTVSKFMAKREAGLLYVDACDLSPAQILEKLSSFVDCVITFDSLPSARVSVHFNGVTDELLLKALAKQFGNYELVKSDAGYNFARKNDVRKVETSDSFCKIGFSGRFFTVDLRDCKFSDAIEKLFSVAKAEDSNLNFCLLANGDVKLQRSVFDGIDFTDTLAKLCAQAGFSYVLDGNIFYIFTNGDAKTELITGNRNWKKYSLKFTKSQDFFSYLVKRVGKLECLALPDENSFLCFASKREDEDILSLIEEVDIEKSLYPISLKYIKPSELMSHLPPSIDKSSLSLADDDSVLYFRGSKSAYENFIKQLELCDQPVKRLSYDLLILQYDETDQNAWSSSLGASRLKLGDKNNVSALLGSVMNFNLNVVTSFGISFAAELQSSIEENKTKVFADTTLHGVSGKKINFQNTNTYRYRDNNVDPDTGLPIYSGVTKEITSGIKLEVLGWVSGDGMITSSVTASLSRQGTDTSSSTGNPPPTSEKIVTTEVRGRSGEAVILSGLVLNAESNQQKRTPILSKLPLLGNLFKAKNTTKEKSQMVIYLVPHLEDEDSSAYEKKFDADWAKERIASFKKRMGDL